MERVTSFPHVNPYTESEDNVEDEDWEDVDKMHKSLAYTETVTSRTVRYFGASTVERKRRSFSRWGPMTKNEIIVKTKNYEVATGSSGNSKDVKKLEREAEEIDEELKKLIKGGEEDEVNLDKIEEHSERRKKIRKAIDEVKSRSLEQEKSRRYVAMIQNSQNKLKN